MSEKYVFELEGRMSLQQEKSELFDILHYAAVAELTAIK